MKIAIDAMGGDHGPIETVKGAVEALNIIDSNIVLIGDENKINKELKKYTYDSYRIEIVHTTEVINNDDKPVKAIKSKKDSSMVKGFTLLKEEEIDAFISAGNTGALLAGGTLKVGRLKGINRPALTTVYPTDNGISILLDVGANTECDVRNLKEFAIMGSSYAKLVLGIDNPKVGLVNIGEEETKGSSLYKESYIALKEQQGINFTGNCEARDVPKGEFDVMVCDGFTGNIILKLSEGLAKSFGSAIKKAIYNSFLSKIGGLLIQKGLNDFKKKMDYTEYGGAPLLGLKHPVVKAHGSSNAKAFMNAFKYADKYAKNDVISEISNILGN